MKKRKNMKIVYHLNLKRKNYHQYNYKNKIQIIMILLMNKKYFMNKYNNYNKKCKKLKNNYIKHNLKLI